MVSCNDLVEYACGTIPVPRTLAIQNRRLGLLLRLLQAAALLWVLCNAIVLRSWLVVSIPVPDSFELWVDAPAGRADVSVAAKPHCATPSVFNYRYNSARAYSFQRCVDLPDGESFEKNGKALFVPTSSLDRYTWQASGAACSDLSTLCVAKGGNFVAEGTDCHCTREELFFAKRPEDVVIHFNHGFMVSFPTGERQRGRVTSKLEFSDGPTAAWKKRFGGQELEMATVILRPDGSRCEVGATSVEGPRSLWTKRDVSEIGIMGTIGEWVRCAGVELDEPRPELGSGRPDEVGSPTSRLTGLELRFDLSYHNSADKADDLDGFGSACYIKVSAVPTWNTVTSVAYSVIPETGTSSAAYRYRQNSGISLAVNARGRFAQFDYMSLLNQFVNAIVILGLPAAIVQFLALYGIGLLSRIYVRAQAQVVDIAQELTGLSARLAASVANFRYMSGGDDDLMLPDIDAKVLRRALQQALEAEIAAGILSEQEFESLVTALFRNLDTGHSASITLREYLAATMSHEIVDPRNLVDFFDLDRRRGVLEKLFTTSKLKRSITGGGVKVIQVRPARANAWHSAVPCVSPAEDEGVRPGHLLEPC